MVTDRTDSSALVIGRLFRDGLEDVHEAIRRASIEPVLAMTDDIVRASREGRTPAVVVLDESRESELALAALRGTWSHQSVPVIQLVRHATTGAYALAHDNGADGVVAVSDLGALTRQVANLASNVGVAPARAVQQAVIFGSEARTRTAVGRLLAHAGFELVFAREASEAAEALASEKVRAVVLVHDGKIETSKVADALRASGREDVIFVICAHPDVARPLAPVATSVARGSVLSSKRIDASLLFALNELMRPAGTENRASPRLLYGTLVSFRRSGEMIPSFGLSSNVSAEGFYVRTLDPPDPGTSVWLELRPPGSRNVVHLRAQAVWRQRYVRAGVALSLPGFGARLDASICPEGDLTQYAKGYATLRSDYAEWPDGIVHAGSDEDVA